jgi:hypothetical protein
MALKSARTETTKWSETSCCDRSSVFSIAASRGLRHIVTGRYSGFTIGKVLRRRRLPRCREFENPDDVPISAPTFHRIRRVLHRLYSDDRVPKAVRSRILEASVRSPQNWHQDAISRAYSSGDRDCGMRTWLRRSTKGPEGGHAGRDNHQVHSKKGEGGSEGDLF